MPRVRDGTTAAERCTCVSRGVIARVYWLYNNLFMYIYIPIIIDISGVVIAAFVLTFFLIVSIIIHPI